MVVAAGPTPTGGARAFSWQVAIRVARVISSGVANDCPGKRLAAKQPPPALLQVQPAGALRDEGVLDAGAVANQSRVETLAWLDRLSVITMIVPSGVGGVDRAQQPLVADRICARVRSKAPAFSRYVRFIRG
jgi:hypothetical protein